MLSFSVISNGLKEFTSGWYLIGIVITGYLSYYLFEVVKVKNLFDLDLL